MCVCHARAAGAPLYQVQILVDQTRGTRMVTGAQAAQSSGTLRVMGGLLCAVMACMRSVGNADKRDRLTVVVWHMPAPMQARMACGPAACRCSSHS